jgi:deoxyhypusine synthase
MTDELARFIDFHFKHFNALSLKKAATDYCDHLEKGGSMLVTLAGAMSTAEIGITLSEMIRSKKVHAICCTGANLEEDVFHLVAAGNYKKIPNWRHMSPIQDKSLLERRLNRVTDVCIPEDVMTDIASKLYLAWEGAASKGEQKFPHEFLWDILPSLKISKGIESSWVYAAMETQTPIFVPGWEDSTLGGMYIARRASGLLLDTPIIKTGVDYMLALIEWYKVVNKPSGIFQIGGGIAGDFPISVVPLINQDLAVNLAEKDGSPVTDYNAPPAKKYHVPLWQYFCQITDAVESYGGYSGSGGSEKISWGKLELSTSMHTINSDASIVAPLIFGYVLSRS